MSHQKVTDSLILLLTHLLTYSFEEDALARLQELQMIQEIRIVPDIYASKPVVHKHEDRISRKIGKTLFTITHSLTHSFTLIPVGNHSSSSSLLMFGMQKEDMIYELRYPWQLYLCEGSIALDLGTGTYLLTFNYSLTYSLTKHMVTPRLQWLLLRKEVSF